MESDLKVATTQWNRVVLQDMPDFGWIRGKVPTGADVSKAAATKMHIACRSGRWKEIIAHDTPESWRRLLGDAHVHFMDNWLTNQEKLRISNERSKEHYNSYIYDAWYFKAGSRPNRVPCAIVRRDG
jgi:hypothetical protein